MSRKKLTIIDIARLAGCGKSTVSRVINKDPRVKQETRDRVEQVIREHNFQPSKSAQSMRTQHVRVIGVLLSRLDSGSENRAVSGMLEVLYEAGYDVVIMESQFDSDKTQEHLQALARRDVDGVILFGFTGFDAELLSELSFQSVVMATDAQSVSSVGYDNQGMIRLAMEKLIGQGVSEISYIGVDPDDRTTGLARLNAYLACCQQHHITPRYSTGQLDYRCAYRRTDQVLRPETQAIVCASDNLALGVMKRLQELGRTDILVSGIGASERLAFLFPNTFSIDPGYFAAGRSAAQLLLEQIDSQGLSQVHHLIQAAQVAS